VTVGPAFDSCIETDFDVVVVGSGAAGLSAAITAAEAGASVLVAEAEHIIGGTSRLSSGMLMGACTRLQQANGISDSPDELYHEYLQLNQWDVDAGLVRRLAEECGPAIEWLVALGVHFHPTLSYGGEESRPRTHFPVGLGMEVIEVLSREAARLGVEVALGRRVDRLLVEGGAVVGVAVGDDELRAGAVVLATGGFGASSDKLRTFLPRAVETGDWMWYMGAAGARGDGLDLGRQVSAQVTGHGRGLCFLTPNFVHEYEATLPGWILLVNRNGRRFCDETSAYGVLDRLVHLQGDRAYVLFDEAARLDAPAGQPANYRQSNPSMPGRRSPNWNDEMIAAMAAAGRLVRAPSVVEVARGLGLPAANVTGTVRRYNGLVEAGEDTDYRKDARFLRPVAQPPFYGAELRPATVALTSAGLRIDVDGRVLDETSSAIPGLFAAGECTGGVLGDVYIGSGNSYSNCVVFGRAAGRAAARGAARGARCESMG
jgi:fumarate reductase flavoprotein subunit